MVTPLDLSDSQGNSSDLDWGCGNSTLFSVPALQPLDKGKGVQDQEELYELPQSLTIFLILLHLATGLTGIVGNLLILWVTRVSPGMRTPTNMFISNLAWADVLILTFVAPFQFQAVLLQRWSLPEFMCTLCPFTQVVSVNVSVFSLLAIAVDRYKAVIFPLSVRISRGDASWAISLIWFLGIVFALPTELDYKVIHLEEGGGEWKPVCSELGLPPKFRMYYNLLLVAIQYLLPLLIIAGAYAHIASKLWGTSSPGNTERLRDAIVLRRKKKTIRMLGIVVLFFAICWLPLQTYNFLQALTPSVNRYKYVKLFWLSSHWLGTSNSCCNPFIYAIFNDKFKKEFRIRLRWLPCIQTEEPQGANL